jgi:hypothetical protein
MIQASISTLTFLTPVEVANRWRRHPSTIRRMFHSMPGVLKFTNYRGRKGAREYVELRIPESLVIELERRFAA